MVVRKVVNELMARLERKTPVRPSAALSTLAAHPPPASTPISTGARTIGANLRHYQPEHTHDRSGDARSVISARARTRANLRPFVLCVDQSGSMATSVVYASIFAAVLASIPGVDTRLVCFDTSVIDLTEQLRDPVDVLFGVQLGGGTDINAALAYCERQSSSRREPTLCSSAICMRAAMPSRCSLGLRP